MDIEKVDVETHIKKYYSNIACLKCSNNICKVYGGRCLKYRLMRWFRDEEVNKLDDYWDLHNEQREDEIRKENRYRKLKKRMIQEISIENMFRIIFE